MRNLLTHTGLIVALLSTNAFAEAAEPETAGVKIGVVDLERAINEVDEGAKAKAELKKEFEAKQGILDKKQEEVKKMQESLESQAAVMKPAVKQEKAMELQKKIGEVQQLYVSMQQDMVKRQQDAMGGILQKMSGTFQALGKEGDFTVILNKSETAVLYVKPSLDLTNEAIRRFNESNKAEAGKDKKKDKEKKKK
jgi:outer membrane protein